MRKMYFTVLLLFGLALFLNVSDVAAANSTNATVTQVSTAASTVQSYVETNHTLPSTVNVSGSQVNMAQFLKLETTAVLNINASSNSTIPVGNYSNPSTPQESLAKSINMNNTNYLNVANNIVSYMNSNGKAPNYATLNTGDYLRFENLVYTFAQILNSYNSTSVLPNFITLNKWSAISNSTTSFFTINQVTNASVYVNNYTQTNHKLPSYVTISGKQVTMPQFLKLATTTTLDINGKLQTDLIYLFNYANATNPQENLICSLNISNGSYLNLASVVSDYFSTNVAAPNYATINTPYSNSPQDRVRFESLVCMFSQILNSYNTTKVLPSSVILNQWSVVSNSSAVLISMNDITNATNTVQSYIETNHQLPNSVTISGKLLNMAQFLQLTSTAVLDTYGNVNTPIALGNYTTPTYPIENITDGDMAADEYIDITYRVVNFLESNGKAPNYASDTSLGSNLGYQSLIYLYAQVMNYYNNTNQTLPDEITIIPWIAVTNPNETYNFNTQKVFSSIQEAINDSGTKNGDTITLGNNNYTENVIINKKLELTPLSTVDVVNVNAANLNLPVFTINNAGNGSYINNLVINGSTSNAGIYINNSDNNTISGDNITNNLNGIYINNSTNSLISDNTITYNIWNGISSYNSSNTTISSNNLMWNGNDGLYINNSSMQVKFNRIVGNTNYGLYNDVNGTINAEDNWWGSNNPNISLNSQSDIGINGGTVNCDQWLVLNVTSSCDRSNSNGTYYDYIITADLTHDNNGNNTSPNGNIPDEIPIYFNTTIGTIETSGSTTNSKSSVKLKSTTSGVANVSATLDNQTIATSVNITNINVLGVYNTRTGKGFNTIQSAINDANTLNGDTITLADGTYTEIITVNKKVNIISVSGANVTVQPVDSVSNVFNITSAGSGSTIQNITIEGASNACGIFLNSTNCTITGDILLDNEGGIYLNNATNNTITNNKLSDNWCGTYLNTSNNNNISGNTIQSNWDGIYIGNSNNNNINGNIITNNCVGIYLITSNNSTISGNNITNNGGGVYYENSNSTLYGNNITSNWINDTAQLDTTGIVMASTSYTCGPAALATVLNGMGMDATEDEIITLAGTEDGGTSMYGLEIAAQAEGLIAKGVNLSVNQLRSIIDL